MGCPRDRVNEEWELEGEGELEPVPQSKEQGREEPGNGEKKVLNLRPLLYVSVRR